MRCVATVVIGLMSFLAFPQSITIELNPGLVAEEDASHGFTRTYRVDSGYVMTDEGWEKLQFPKDFKAEDTAFAKEYFTGYPGKVLWGNGLLIANYKSGFPTIYVDGNNNLNFADDGKPVQFSPEDTTAILTFRNEANPIAKFMVKYDLPDSSPEHFKELDEMFGTAQSRANGSSILEIPYWFYTKRLNNKMTKTVLAGDSVKVALHDADCNGYFNDPEKDKIFIGPANIPFTSRNISWLFTLNDSSNLFSYNQQVYEITEVDSLGRSITFEPTTKAFEKSLSAGDTMPDLAMKESDGDSIHLTSMLDGKRHLLIALWANWCKPCHASAPTLAKFAEKNQEDLTILGISPSRSEEEIKEWTEKYSHNWTQLYMSPEFYETFRIDGYPTYILIDPSGKIMSLQMRHPSEITEITDAFN